MLKIYLTDLAAYNVGILVGKWITLPLDENELSVEIEEVLSQGESAVDGDNHEEWFITDFEWTDINLFNIQEYENINKLNQQVQLLESIPSSQLKSIKFILDERFTDDIEDAILRADDVIIHENQSMEDVAYELMQECYEIDKFPSIIANNINYDRIARDLEMDGNYYTVGDDVVEYIG